MAYVIISYYLQAEIWVLWAKRDREPGKGILVERQVKDNSWLNEF